MLDHPEVLRPRRSEKMLHYAADDMSTWYINL